MSQNMSDKLFLEGISSLGLKPAVLEAVLDIHNIVYGGQLSPSYMGESIGEQALNEGVLGTLAKLGLGIGAGVILMTGGQALERSNITHEPLTKSLAHVVGADAGFVVNKANSVKDSVLGVGDAFVDIGKTVEKGYNKTNPSKPAQTKNAPKKPIKRVAGK